MFLFLPWLARLAGLPNGRVPADGSPWRTDDGRVVQAGTNCPRSLKPKGGSAGGILVRERGFLGFNRYA